MNADILNDLVARVEAGIWAVHRRYVYWQWHPVKHRSVEYAALIAAAFDYAIRGRPRSHRKGE